MRNLWCSLGALLSFLFAAPAGATHVVQQATLSASDVAALDEFGGRTSDQAAFSVDGSTLLVSALQANCSAGPDCGAAYVFVRTAGGWAQQAKLSAPDAAPGDGAFLVALSGDGSMALVGAYGADCSAGPDCGAVYFFVRNGTVWSFQQKLTASDASAGDFFGVSVGLSRDGTVALVGASHDDCGSFPVCGSVYAFTRSGGTWAEQQKFGGDPGSDNFFGGILTLSADGNTALILGDFHRGAIAARAYVFTRSAGTWSFQTKLEPLGDPPSFASAMDLSADGSVAFVYEDHGFGEDFVYVFTRTGTTWSLESLIFIFGDGLNGSSNLAVSDDGETLLLKTPRFCSSNTCHVASVFRREQGGWRLDQGLVLSSYFDVLDLRSVDISGDGRTLLVADPGAPCASGSSCGVVHVFGEPELLANVPTVSHLGLTLLALLLAASGAWRLARKEI